MPFAAVRFFLTPYFKNWSDGSLENSDGGCHEAMSGARDSDKRHKRDTRSAPRAAVHRRDADD